MIKAGVQLDSPNGIQATAWQTARGDKKIADLLLQTTGAVRLTLTRQEQERVDRVLYQDSMKKMGDFIQQMDTPELLHAIVNSYNWDSGPGPMFSVFHNPAIAKITLLDMYELMDGDYWLAEEEPELQEEGEGMCWRELAEALRKRIR
ncbi:DUF4274 domain-containing protein [Gorillibacterium sp. CAU 1737]|uniref:DUF4274 domain-containing protein n=1 Tax=Gorillibacterium sp. CAU 1737 TaxID=3140362 RepID=UPI00326034F2